MQLVTKITVYVRYGINFNYYVSANSYYKTYRSWYHPDLTSQPIIILGDHTKTVCEELLITD